MRKKISIIIPTSFIPGRIKADKVLSQCIRGIERETHFRDCEIIIIDSIMYESPSRILLDMYSKKGYKVLPYPFKFQRYKVLNHAAKYATGEFLLFLDNDTVLHRGWLTELLKVYELKKDAGIAGPMIRDFNSPAKISTGYEVEGDKLVESHNEIKGIYEKAAIPVTCFLIKRELYNRLNGFDETFIMYNGEVDLCLRTKKEGFVTYVNTYAEILHYGGLTRGIFREKRSYKLFDDQLLKRRWFAHGRKTNDEKNMLVVKLLTFGDAVLVTPTISALRKKYPDYKITFVTSEPYRDIFEGNPNIDEFLCVPAKSSNIQPGAIYYDEVCAKLLCQKDWDLFFELNCLDFWPEYRRTGLHFRDYYAAIAGVYPLEDSRYYIPFGEKERRKIDNLLSQIKPGGKIICIHAKGGWQLKNWPEERWMKLVAKLARRYSCRVIVLGGEGEKINSPFAVNLAGKLSFKELSALLEKADLFIGPDSGMMHLASAVNTPIVAFYGPTHSHVGAPMSSRYITIQAPLSCEVPCGRAECRKGIRCVDSIAVDTVYRAACKMLDTKENLQEHWKGDKKAKIFFKDWEWHSQAPITAQKESASLSCGHLPKADGKLSVLFQSRGGLFFAPGGDTENVLGLESALRKMNISVDYSESEILPLDGYDIIQHFNFNPTQAITSVLQNKPYCVLPMYEDFKRYYAPSIRVVPLFREYIENGNREKFEEKLSNLRSTDFHFTPPDYKFACENAECVFVTGEEEATRIREDFPGVKRVEVIKLGINSPPEAAEDVSPDAFVSQFGVKDFILCVGRLETRKNQLMLLYALQDVDIPIVFVNSPSPQPEYERLCKNFPRKAKTIFTGRISRELLYSAYKAARVHVSVSWFELPGLTTLEAGLFGCPVVSTEWGTIKDYVGDDVIYCEPDNPKSILESVLFALDNRNSQRLRERLREFTWDKTATKIVAVYEQVLDKWTSQITKRQNQERIKQALIEMNYQRLIGKSTAFQNAGALNKSIKYAKAALKIKPNSAVIYYNLGLSYLKQERLKEAERNLIKAIELSNYHNDPNPYLYLALSYMCQAKYSEASKLLEELLAIDVHSNDREKALVHAYLGRCYKNMGQVNRAIQYYQKSLALNPTDKKAIRELERLMKTNNNMSEEVRRVRKRQLTL